MSIFTGDLFDGMAGLGDLPSGARSVETLSYYRGPGPVGRVTYPSLPSDAMLASKNATHFTMRQLGPTSAEFTFYTAEGERSIGPLTVYASGSGPVSPDVSKEENRPLPARREGDGLLPSAVPSAPSQSREPRWLPWALLGGGLLVGGGIILAVTRKPRAVASNRRRRRRRTSR